jgi:hypothetical protein
MLLFHYSYSYTHRQNLFPHRGCFRFVFLSKLDSQRGHFYNMFLFFSCYTFYLLF